MDKSLRPLASFPLNSGDRAGQFCADTAQYEPVKVLNDLTNC